jgi:hypothetical protein
LRASRTSLSHISTRFLGNDFRFENTIHALSLSFFDENQQRSKENQLWRRDIYYSIRTPVDFVPELDIRENVK